MQSFASFKANNKPSILVVGRPGSGKSTLVSMLGRVHIIDLDNNIAGPFQFLTETKQDCKASFDQPLLLPTGQMVPRKDRWKALNAAIMKAAADPEIEVIAIDSLTALVDCALDEVRRQFNKTIGDLTAGTPDAPFTLPDWGAFAKLITEWVYRLKTSGKVIVITAHIEVDKDELTQVLKEFVKIPGQHKSSFSGMFSEAWLIKAITEGTGSQLKQKYIISTIGTGATETLGLKSGVQIKHGTEVDFAALRNRILS